MGNLQTCKACKIGFPKVRDQEVGGSNPLAPTKFLKDLHTPKKITGSEKGPFLDPTLTRMSRSIARCPRVLIDLLSDHFDDLLGPYQEV